jgi:DNA-binding NarL/FixJ family response regulator
MTHDITSVAIASVHGAVAPRGYQDLFNSPSTPMQSTTISVAIIEDLRDIALDLQETLNEELDMVCKQVYHDAESAISFLTQNPADVVLCDIGLPGKSGIEAIITLRERHPQMAFCMFTVFEDVEKIFGALQAGAKGYILKNSDPDQIVKALRDLYHGGSPINPAIARKVIDAFAAAPVPEAKDTTLPLTEREFQLLDLLAQGLLYKEIGQQMGITTGTVKQHIHKIYHKLQVNNRTEAINRYLGR